MYYFLKKKTKKKVAPDAAKTEPIRIGKRSELRKTSPQPRMRHKKAINATIITNFESLIEMFRSDDFNKKGVGDITKLPPEHLP